MTNTKGKKKPKKGGAHKSIKCYKCDDDLDESDNAMSLQCEFCEAWACAHCSKIPKKLYDCINEHDAALTNFIWVCDGCKNELPNLKGLKATMVKNTDKVEGLEKSLTKLEEKLQSIENKVQEEVQKAFSSEQVKKMVAAEIDKTLNDKLIQREDRISRENNLMIFKLEESDETDNDKRREADISVFDHLCTDALKIDKKKNN